MLNYSHTLAIQSIKALMCSDGHCMISIHFATLEH
nr:MAG TPA: hypothetical protein [Caudoviricetes sp.]